MRIIDGRQYGWVEAIGIHHVYHWLSVYEGYEGDLTTIGWTPSGPTRLLARIPTQRSVVRLDRQS